MNADKRGGPDEVWVPQAQEAFVGGQHPATRDSELETALHFLLIANS
jgi:hypothetical protein